jgi:hypothetical protein
MTLRLYIPIDAGALAGSAVEIATARQNLAIEIGFSGSSQLTRSPQRLRRPATLASR